MPALLPHFCHFRGSRQAQRIHFAFDFTIGITSRTMCSLACAYSVLFDIPTIRTEHGNALTARQS
ncbi:hypothetical protein EN871_05395 [bacterium M00.F.Ca.ET.228.01.1.1]|nr:hypothetical protein EN871_05395 [bacterium M00.F.Ca.ET.228.01.1.1]TGS04187.1 hypothetical protein EN834_07590 [bacterium M00.F.Ca.ET.191.01.1.1]TGU07193.1 hypothetical protein EN798_09470 [bacterium M00.F.Ca.ET.155.01.1.1]